MRDGAGTLIARYINGRQDASVEALPVRIHAEHNGAGDRQANGALVHR